MIIITKEMPLIVFQKLLYPIYHSIFKHLWNLSHLWNINIFKNNNLLNN